MQESFLHYLWQFQYFDKHDLRTADGEAIHIFSSGNRNTHAGPDFFNARIRIGDMEWIGNVEIHVNASGWLEHKHEFDAAYENVILHVVWKNDKPVKRNDHSVLPCLELKNRVDEQLLLRYKTLVNNPATIPCANTLGGVDSIIRLSMLDKALMQRLENKAKNLLDFLERNQHDWDETCYQLLCRNFGFKVNAEPFLQLACTLPYKLILKQSDKLLQIEAMLFGQAGFLDEALNDEYYQLLRREYQLLGTKYTLTERKLNKAQWRFLRLRPANFPTIRLAQLAMLLFSQKNLFSKILETENIKQLKNIFHVQQSSYWKQHYQFLKKAKDEMPSLGDVSVENIMINTVAPLLVAYSQAKGDQRYTDRAIDILQHVPPEENAIVRQWISLGMKCESSFDSQALIELHNNFCLRRKCLDCNIGSSMIKPKTR